MLMKPPTYLFRGIAPAILTVALSGILGAAATHAVAQPPDLRADERAEPWRGPAPPPVNLRNATSDVSATEPTPAEQRETRKLAGAVFSQPAAAARAADKAAPPTSNGIPPAPPKPGWLGESAFHPGGDGLELKSPF